MNTLPADEIPVLTDIVEPNTGSESAFINDTNRFLHELESHLTTVVHEHADELVHNALREMEALLLEQVSDRLKAELPRIVSRVIAEHFRGPGRAN
jgi:uncharacterized protein (DUF2267 family)